MKDIEKLKEKAKLPLEELKPKPKKRPTQLNSVKAQGGK